jgi:hypothetical protein
LAAFTVLRVYQPLTCALCHPVAGVWANQTLENGVNKTKVSPYFSINTLELAAGANILPSNPFAIAPIGQPGLFQVGVCRIIRTSNVQLHCLTLGNICCCCHALCYWSHLFWSRLAHGVDSFSQTITCIG